MERRLPDKDAQKSAAALELNDRGQRQK